MVSCAACGDQHPDDAHHCPVTGEPVGVGPCGTQLDRYAVERLLGGGGMGAVYRGRHVLLGQPVAVKLLRGRVADNPDVVRRFQREAQAAAAVGNPHIVRVSDFGETAAGQAFLVMELLEGADLESVIARRGPLPVEQAVDIALQLLDGLGAAHGAGIVHRDLKPGNVFLTTAPGAPTGPRDFVKIVDFGISKVTTETGHSLTKTGVVLGTPYYMAPEQARAARDQDHRVDLYAAAVILYQMLARALPFDGESYEELVIRICTEAPRPLAQLAPHVPRRIVEVVERGMSRDPRDRWPTARAFAEGLSTATGAAAPRMGPTGPRTPAPLDTPSPTPVPVLPSAPPPVAAPPAPAVAAAPAASATTAPVARLPEGKPRRSWLLPGALVFLALAILAAAGVAAWIAARAPDPGAFGPPPPGTAGGLVAPLPPAPGGVALVPVGSPPPVAPPRAAPRADDDDDTDWLDLSDVPSAEEIARLNSQAAAMVPVPPAPAPTNGVSIGQPYVLGDFDVLRFSRLAPRVAPDLQRCRRPGSVARVRVQAMMSGIDVPLMSTPGATDLDQAACVSNTVRDVFQQVGASPEGGIVYVEIALAPRP